jgi:hypothetical protein
LLVRGTSLLLQCRHHLLLSRALDTVSYRMYKILALYAPFTSASLLSFNASNRGFCHARFVHNATLNEECHELFLRIVPEYFDSLLWAYLPLRFSNVRPPAFHEPHMAKCRTHRTGLIGRALVGCTAPSRTCEERVELRLSAVCDPQSPDL